MTETAIERQRAALESGTVTRSNIIGLRKLFNAAWRIDSGYSATANPRIDDTGKVWRLFDILCSNAPIVCGTLHDSGLAVLRNPRYAKRLAPYRHIIDNLASFHLVDFEDIGRGHFVPVYRITATDGVKAYFRNVPWQSGGNGPKIWR